MEHEQSTSEETSAQFMKRVSSIPVIESTWTQLSVYYNKAKEYNTLVKYAFDKAESGAKTVLNTAQPVLDKYQTQINAADNFACNQLDKLEEKCPAIKKTPQQIVTDSKEMCSTLVQPAVDKVNTVKQFGDTTVDNIKYFSSLENSKDYGMKQVLRASNYTYSQLQWLLQTDYGQQLLHQVEVYLTYSEDALDKYLPAADDSEEPGKELEASKEASLARVGNISQKLKKRVYAKAMKELETAQARSKEALNKLIASYTLIETLQQNIGSSKERIQNVKEKVMATWKDVMSEEDPYAGKSFDEKTNNEIAITLARHVAKQAQETIHLISSNLPEAPDVVKQLVKESQQYSQNLYTTIQNTESIKDISSTLFHKTTESLLGLQQIFQTLLKTPLSYITSLPKSEEIEMTPVNPSSPEETKTEESSTK
ncbi:perilipin-3 [Octopus bimaculoides]|uniref:Perilipin n=1 Tax=Octopus bimaculoides TaxID=37653 RepID=A0A0L8H2A2_OCTBM|nr:perilipin-3 [Octopus bimaculoides]|eukprot:XP_014775985.1 PREDICTED: perilipin-3-like [Octopus bimaculoides]